MSFDHRRSSVHDLVNHPAARSDGQHWLLAQDCHLSNEESDVQKKQTRPILPPIDTPDRCASILGCVEAHPKGIHDKHATASRPTSLPGIHALTAETCDFRRDRDTFYHEHPSSGQSLSERARFGHEGTQRAMPYGGGYDRKYSDKESSGAVTSASDPSSCHTDSQSRDSFSALLYTSRMGSNALESAGTASSSIESASHSAQLRSRLSSGQYNEKYPTSYRNDLFNQSRSPLNLSEYQLSKFRDQTANSRSSTSADDFAVQTLASMRSGQVDKSGETQRLKSHTCWPSANLGDETLSPTNVRGIDRYSACQVFERRNPPPISPNPTSSFNSAQTSERRIIDSARSYPHNFSTYRLPSNQTTMSSTDVDTGADKSSVAPHKNSLASILARGEEKVHADTSATVAGAKAAEVSYGANDSHETQCCSHHRNESFHGYGPVANHPPPTAEKLATSSNQEIQPTPSHPVANPSYESSPTLGQDSVIGPATSESLQSYSGRMDRSFDCNFMEECNTANNNPRKGFSDYFGRNKICTKAIPEKAWLMKCRQHYQRIKYRCQKQRTYGSYKAGSLLSQIQRFDDLMGSKAYPRHGPIKWTIGFQKELTTAIQKAQARAFQGQPLLLESDNKKTQELMKQVNIATKLVDKTGENKTSEDCKEFIQQMQNMCNYEKIGDLIPAEFLPVSWGGKEYSRGVNATRH